MDTQVVGWVKCSCWAVWLSCMNVWYQGWGSTIGSTARIRNSQQRKQANLRCAQLRNEPDWLKWGRSAPLIRLSHSVIFHFRFRMSRFGFLVFKFYNFKFYFFGFYKCLNCGLELNEGVWWGHWIPISSTPPRTSVKYTRAWADSQITNHFQTNKLPHKYET